MRKYILDANKEPVLCEDVHEWGRWMQTADRTVAKTAIGPYLVSTVFLGIDHNFSNHGPPLVYETMTFGPDHQECGITARSVSRITALESHADAVHQAEEWSKWVDEQAENPKPDGI